MEVRAIVFAVGSGGIAVRDFGSAQEALGDLDAEAAGALISAATDIALILDPDGTIRDLALRNEQLAASLVGWEHWLGRNWRETVTVESRNKVTALLRDPGAAPAWRHINHPAAQGPDVAVLYTSVRIGSAGRIVAVGRDLGAISAMQQRVVDAQQTMERDYSRLRHAEMRYRLLFQLATEAVMVIDAPSQKVIDANPAAGQLFNEPSRRVVGRTFPWGFDEEGLAAIQALLAAVRAAGRADDVRARLVGTPAEPGREFQVSAALFRQDSAAMMLIRLSAAPAEGTAPAMRARARLLQLIETAPDGFVVTAQDGRILIANTAFVDMTQMATEEQVRGESLDRWLGRTGVDLNVLTANLRQRGSVRLFATTFRGEYGTATDVEICASSILEGDQTCFGFAIRSTGRRLAGEPRTVRELPRSVEQLTELVGRVSLKDLVRETTDVIERLCIETALVMTNDNHASAAKMLGLSRQSLYVKLRRHGVDALAESEG
jgi:transcriptional regulator PpsR